MTTITCKILAFKRTSIAVLLLLMLTNMKSMAQTTTVTVFAGRDTAICKNASLNLAQVGAYIRGEVTDGTWFHNGDGYFFPGNTATGQFSKTQRYIPGNNDISRGYVDLTLVSFDPDDLGPKVQVSDVMRLTLLSEPPMVCNNNLNVSLAANCSQEILASMLISNPQGNLNDYKVTLYDKGVLLPSNTITRAYLNKQLEFKVNHMCGSNSCWGYITAQDKEGPRLICKDTTIECTSSLLPDSIGFPLKSSGTITLVGPNRYNFDQGDNCGKATLIYTDEITKLNCAQDGFISSIIRKWEAIDDAGNKSLCFQTIFVKAKGISTLSLPKNYDDIERAALVCGTSYKTLAGGNPHPDITGSPNIGGCTNLESTFVDQIIPVCGNSVKIIRKWLLIDWCNSSTKEHIQIIKVLDKTPPKVSCSRDTIFKTTAYECHTGKLNLPKPKITDECGIGGTFTAELFDTLGRKKNEFLDQLNETYFIKDLPVGKYKLIYTGFDQCGNKDTCSMQIKVIDDQPPFAVCAEKLVVTFNEDKTLRMFPDALNKGSVDNCAIAKLELAKMVDSCQNKPNVFGPYLDFCCKELGKTIMVSLRVTDVYGNSNTCMAEVMVLDKKAPVLTCPPSITVNCDYAIDLNKMSEFGTIVQEAILRKDIKLTDKYNKGATVGKDGLASDNCSVSIREKVTDKRVCKTGQIIRTFYGEDASGNLDSCIQIITVVDVDPFKGSNITWPRDTTLMHCGVQINDPSTTGKPKFTNTGCAVLVADFEDLVFETQDGSCYKIVRTWTVLDWCKFEAGDQSGVWKKDQIIKINNTVAPTFTTACKDTSLCLFSETCGTQRYQYTIQAKDDCTPDSLLSYRWYVDLDANGTLDFTGVSKTVDALVGKGNHKVSIEVFDRCGNKVSCSFILKGKDCKAPSPYCIESLSTAVMNTNGEIEIWASDLDKGSFDNCSPKSKLKFSFSKDTTDGRKIIRCKDIANGKSQKFTYEIWVTDEDGNQDFCTANLIVQDNSDVCKDGNFTTSLTGNMRGIFGESLSSVEVMVMDTIDHMIKPNQMFSSQYTLNDLFAKNRYKLHLTKKDDAANGINVLDILMIQKHVLNIDRFKNPLQILAADVNNSGHVSVADIAELRKIVLGVNDKFSGNLPIWNFLDAQTTFSDPLKPTRNPSYVMTPILPETVSSRQDILAYKLGDVSPIGGALGIRSSSALRLENNSDQLELVMTGSNNPEALQLELIAPGISAKHLKINPSLSSNIYTNQIDDNRVRLIYYSAAPTDIDHNLLFTTELKDLEIYGFISDGESVSPVELRNKIEKTNESLTIWWDGVHINIRNEWNKAQTYGYKIYNTEGRLMLDGSASVMKGQNGLVQVPTLQNGIYMVEVFNERMRTVDKVSLFR